MNDKVSIIVPIYKSEKYLKRCIESILQQDYPNKEIILVNDGSPDNCPTLCEEYAEKNADVIVLHQENRGVGAARNAGLEIATGKYICFVDADDCFDGNHAITALVHCAREKNADIVVGNFRQLTEHGALNAKFYYSENDVFVNTVDFRFKGFFQYGHLGFNWGKCYKKEFLERFKLKCTEVPFTEDKAMNLCCCACEPIYAFVTESVYLYRLNEESVTYSYQTNLAEIWVSTAEHLQQFLEGNNCKGHYGDLMDFHICLGIFTIIRQEILSGNKKISGISRKLKEYAQTPFVRECMKELARGRYVFQINSGLWKILIWGVSVAFSMHGYFLIALGYRLLNDTTLDRKIIAHKYKKEEKR